jgi:hypothetical protein
MPRNVRVHARKVPPSCVRPFLFNLALDNPGTRIDSRRPEVAGTDDGYFLDKGVLHAACIYQNALDKPWLVVINEAGDFDRD